MILYTVSYKKIGAKAFERMTGVQADGFIQGQSVRWFVLEDKTYVEICTEGLVFVFGAERDELVKKNQEAELAKKVK